MEIDEEYTPDIITLSDEDGKEYVFEVLDEYEDDNGRYLALLPTDPAEDIVGESEDEDDEGDLVILKSYEEKGETYYEEIDNDEEYDKIADIFADRLKDLFDVES